MNIFLSFFIIESITLFLSLIISLLICKKYQNSCFKGKDIFPILAKLLAFSFVPIINVISQIHYFFKLKKFSILK